MKVIMLRSNPVSPDSRLEKEATTLGKAGNEVLIIGWLRYGKAPLFEKKDWYSIKRIKFSAPLGKKVLFFLPLYWVLLFTQLMKEDCDIIHAADLDTYIPSILAAKIKNKKIIYDIFDFYGDMVALPKFIRNAVAKFDTFLMKFSDAIVIVDPTRVKQLNIKEGSAVVIYNSPSEEIIRGYQGLSREGNLFRIFYAGGLYRDRDFKTVIDVIKKNKGIMFEIAGWGEYEKEILQLINNEPDVTFIGSLPYPEVLKKTLQSDLLIALYNPAIPNNRFSSPNKIFEAMMCRKPIIVSDGTTMADIVRENDCGVVVPFGDLKSLEDAVLVLCNDPVLSEKLGVNGRKAFDEKYRWEIMEKKLLSVYDSLYRKDPSRYQRIFNGDR